jgi:hypothetical protein
MMNDHIATGPRERSQIGTSNVNRIQYQKMSVNLNGIDRLASKAKRKSEYTIQIESI